MSTNSLPSNCDMKRFCSSAYLSIRESEDMKRFGIFHNSNNTTSKFKAAKLLEKNFNENILSHIFLSLL